MRHRRTFLVVAPGMVIPLSHNMRPSLKHRQLCYCSDCELVHHSMEVEEVHRFRLTYNVGKKQFHVVS
jgi:hypothetical protein